MPAEIQLMIAEFASNKPTCMRHWHRTHKKKLIHLSKYPQVQGRIVYREKFTGFGGVNYYDESLALLRVCHDSLTIAKKTRSQPYLTKYGSLVFDFDARFLSQNKALEDNKTLDAEDLRDFKLADHEEK
ncbi:hypothetical protein EAF00_006351 [Botryotinia globosa]|nr:hypothetical protein EAF00_006351 [Botryotinia globosa]